MTPLETPENQAVDSNCIFCKIISGELPSRRIYEDDRAVAFLDIGAWHRGHALVVPKRHVPDLITGPATLAEIAPAIDAVARLLMDRLDADGINLLSSTGEAITDGWITTKLKAKFSDEKLLKDSKITVETSDRVVTLQGTVSTDAAKRRAVTIANGTEGVLRVVDKLVVKVK